MKKFFVLVLISLVLPIFSWAAVNIIPEDNQKNTKGIDCDLYYNFQKNLKLDIQSIKREAKGGEIINFSGSVVNKNIFPVGGSSIYVKIFKDDAYQVQNDISIDQFYAIENNTILADGVLNYKFNWKVQNGLSMGNYKAVVYFSQNNNIFYDVSNTYNFRIRSEDDKDSFDLSDIKFNGVQYSKNILIDKDELATVSFELKNNLSKDLELYVDFLSFESSGKEVNNSREYFTLKPNETKIVSYQDNTKSRDVSLRFDINSNENSKKINIGYSRDGFANGRIKNFGLSNFPLDVNKNSVFLCLNSPLLEEEKLDLFLLGINGQVLNVNKYNKDDLVGLYLFKDIKEKYNDNKIKLVVSIDRNGQNIEYKELDYDCAGGCLKTNKNMNIDRTMDTSSRTFIILITLILMMITTIYFVSHKKETRPKGDDIIEN